MSATKYQLLYRYTNPNSNQFIKNDTGSTYDNVFEFYHEGHQIEVGTEEEILEANNKKSDLIIQGNNTAIDNYNMLFKFTGTKRKNKNVWVDKSIGYVIRDKEAVRHLTTRAVDGDYSGEYLLIEGDSIDNGIVISKTNPVKSTITVISDDSEANEKDYYTESFLYNKITKSTIAKLNTTVCFDHSSPSLIVRQQIGGTSYGVVPYRDVYVGPIAVNVQRNNVVNSYSSIYGSLSNVGLYASITIKAAQVQTYEIPAHYEEFSELPYAICDTYKQIEQSPWFILSTHASLLNAMEKAKKVVKAVGIDNVKLIKIVPTEQFIKLK